MKYKQSLTNEALSRQFNSSFELVNYAIKLAGNMVKSGRAPRVAIEEENPAVVVLEEIAAGRDLIEDLNEIEAAEPNSQIAQITSIDMMEDDEEDEEEEEPKVLKKMRK